MKLTRPGICALVLILLAGSPRMHADEAPATPDAQAILDAVVARLPRETLEIEGDLITRKPRGVVVNTLRFAMRLDWGATPATARYTIRDTFGADLEELTLSRSARGQLSARYAKGSPLAPADVPALTTRIQQTDLSWTDLSLAFLWWPGARVTGTDSVRGRPCYILDVPAPAETVASDAVRYAFVRIWVDQELSLLMQAEAYSPAGIRVRRLWVRSLKKQGDRWMIKDLEVQAYPPVQRTRLHVNAVDTPPQP
ncbi:MAG: outer membrane lipoprotein-sorting protein [Lentisphaerae bacterium]|nr:outer membrane lipoprotein-sorting protein [Lentisphaerota bacterium]